MGYTYNLSGTVSAGDDLAIYYPSGTSSSISDLGTSSTGWTTFALQADTSIPANGEYDIVANTSSASLPSTFETTFNYSGTGSPAAQSFTLYDSSFGILQTGLTSATVPEIDANSSAGALALLAGVLVIFRGRKPARKA